jgi:hypothetical protein
MTGGSMVGQSIVHEAASGDEIRLYNFGGQIFEDSTRLPDSNMATKGYLHVRFCRPVRLNENNFMNFYYYLKTVKFEVLHA